MVGGSLCLTSFIIVELMLVLYRLGSGPIGDNTNFKGERKGCKACWMEHRAGWDGLRAS